MATAPFPVIPVGSNTGGPNWLAGAMRYNTTSNLLEVYTGTVWIPASATDLKTWQEWFDYYIGASGTIPDLYTKQVYIQQEMQARFPGNYQVDLAGHDWVMVFESPRDETWFHLKYE
jgi:hypothetical protein